MYMYEIWLSSSSGVANFSFVCRNLHVDLPCVYVDSATRRSRDLHVDLVRVRVLVVVDGEDTEYM